MAARYVQHLKRHDCVLNYFFEATRQAEGEYITPSSILLSSFRANEGCPPSSWDDLELSTDEELGVGNNHEFSPSDFTFATLAETT